ncbi:hypothetical protein [Scytonema sp. PCC 10023]|uniref:hypothetical protein n=1 Tax=Scytonema sp. PCC 10023 TaxID=1680591 RepID=UPI0039C5D02D
MGHAFTSWTTDLTLLCRELQFIGHLTKEFFPVGHCNCANAQKEGKNRRHKSNTTDLVTYVVGCDRVRAA